MSDARLRTVLVGFGQVADTLGDDARMRTYFRHASHAEVLSQHSAFLWDAVVDPSDEALARARQKWGIARAVHDLAELGDYSPDVAVIAAPPAVRRSVVERLPKLKAVLVEKPLGRSLAEAEDFARLCEARRMTTQVHFWRRSVPAFRRLAEGGLRAAIGTPQAAFALYGRGLNNNGSHLIDFVAMLLGDVIEARAVGTARVPTDKDLEGDIELPFVLRTAGDLTVMVEPVDFRHYREIALDVWGTTGRLNLMQESLAGLRYPLAENRGLTGEREIASDRPELFDAPVADAYWEMYDNLAAAVAGRAVPLCPVAVGLRTARVVDAIVRSQRADGAPQTIH